MAKATRTRVPSKRGTLTQKEQQKDMSTAKANLGPKIRAPKLQVVENKIVPIKVGLFGGQGSGKTTTTALIALGLSVQHHNRAPVFVTDTEPGWHLLKRLFAAEGVELIQRTTPTFKAMLSNIEEARKLGACAFAVDSLTVIWNELMQSFKKRNGGRIPINKWGDIKQMWGEYATAFLNSPLHCFALGRLGNVMEEVEDEVAKDGSTKLVKTGTQFKAGGGESFGYEPHLLLELTDERKNKVQRGSVREGEGRMNHRIDVLKDRTWAMNGKVIRLSDKPRYEKGGFMTTWNAIKPHFDEYQLVASPVQIGVGEDSTSLIADSGSSEWYEKQQRRDVLAAELHASMEVLFGGSTQAAKRLRLLVFEHVFGFRSKEAADKASLETIERGVRIMQAFENRTRDDQKILSGDEAEILAELDCDIAAFDDGENDEDIPF